MLVQDVYLFSSYFWDRLWRNFDHACDVTKSILAKNLITLSFYCYIQPSVKKRRKWLVPICMSDHWISAVSFRRNVTNLKSRFEEFVSVLIL